MLTDPPLRNIPDILRQREGKSYLSTLSVPYSTHLLCGTRRSQPRPLSKEEFEVGRASGLTLWVTVLRHDIIYS